MNGMFGVPVGGDRRARLMTAEIVVIDEAVEELIGSMKMVIGMAKEVEGSRGAQALTAATRAIEAVDFDSSPLNVAAAQGILDTFLGQQGAPGRFKVHAIGHCHIDTAWLWPYRETKRKCVRSWASQLRLLERHPSYHFCLPQMQQLDWLRVGYPQLWSEVKARVAEGRLIPIGGSWVEMDGNMPGGEAICRHLLYGQRFIKEHFGFHSRVFWLPDTFGYLPQFPQLLKLAGMSYFLTQKLSWNAINKMPVSSFWWRGLDGSTLLAHFPPADTYTSDASVREIKKSEEGCKQKAVSNDALLVFGHGDGGGGPTEAMIRRLERLGDTDGLPIVTQCDPLDFFKQLEKSSSHLPTWQGELYLELHRGTLTSQAKIKYYNRRCESLMREAEAASALAALLLQSTAPDAFPYPAADLERLWKLVLLNQFHDVLPGSSIEAVYHDASKIYQQVEYEASRIRELAIRAIFHHARLSTAAEMNAQPSIVFFNTTPFTRSDIVVVPYDPDPDSPQPGVLAIQDIPPLSMATLPEATKCNSRGSVSVRALSDPTPSFIMENDFCRVHVDGHGRILSYWDKVEGREAMESPGNQLWIYEDTPNAWDAWDVDAFYRDKATCLDTCSSVEIGMRGPLLVSIIRRVKISATSSMTQVISLNCVSPLLDFYSSVEWSEAHRFLRVLFPVAIASDYATFETAFGQLRRPTHANTSWDAAKFEICAHRFVDLSEPGYGVALLNDSKYGHSVRGNVIGLSLLRAPKYPDPTCDQSKHIIRYALLPHAGTPEDAGVHGEAYKYNNPLRWTSVPRGSYDPAWLDKPFMAFAWHGLKPTQRSMPPLVLDTIKQPEDSTANPNVVIVRAYEPVGARGTAQLVLHPILKLTSMQACNILEEPQSELCTTTPHGVVSFNPFQVITLKLELQLIW